jgi:hypothetical protein
VEEKLVGHLVIQRPVAVLESRVVGGCSTGVWIVVAWFQPFSVPLLIMAPIRLTLVGILPVHALMGAFTARSIIGFIVGAGIVRDFSVRLETSFQLGEKLPVARHSMVRATSDSYKHRRLLKPMTASAHVNLRAMVKAELNLVH